MHMRMQAYTRTKLRNGMIVVCCNKKFEVGQSVFLCNSQLRLFPSKLKSRWSGPFTITKVWPHGAIEVIHPKKGTFKVNGQRLKPYIGGEDFQKVNVVTTLDSP